MAVPLNRAPENMTGILGRVSVRVGGPIRLVGYIPPVDMARKRSRINIGLTHGVANVKNPEKWGTR